MFATVLDKLQTALSSLFSTSFLLGNFFLVLIIAIVNFGLAWLGIDGFAERAADWNPISGAANAAAEFLLLVLVAVLLGPLVAVLRSLLDGAILPQSLRQRGHEHWRRIRADLQQKSQAASDTYVYFSRQVDPAVDQLQRARAQGNSHTTFDRNAVDEAERQIDIVGAQMDSDGLPERAVLQDAISGLEQALQQNWAAAPDNNPNHCLAVRTSPETPPTEVRS